jgi:hypothetical protein
MIQWVGVDNVDDDDDDDDDDNNNNNSNDVQNSIRNIGCLQNLSTSSYHPQ